MPSLRMGLVAGVLACAAFAPGCYVEAGPPTMVTAAEVEADYAPAYYDGYVVYYDTVGRPYYYDRGSVVWVSRSSPHYVGLETHWRTYNRSYARWNVQYGPRYRTYRAPPGHYAYRGYRRAAPPARYRRR